MDFTHLMSMLPQNAYNKGYEAETQNQLRQAQAMQLIKEAMAKEAMLPYNIQDKAANADYMSAMAQKMRQDATLSNEQRFADKIAKGDAAKRLSAGRDSRGILETALQMAQLPPTEEMNSVKYLDEAIKGGKLRSDLVSRLQPGNVNLYTNDNIRQIIDSINAEDPEAAKTTRIGMQQQGQTERNNATIASRERIANLNGSIKSEIAKANREGKPLSKSQVEGILLQKVMSGEITPEEMKALDIAQALAYNKGAAPGVAATIDAEGNIVFAPSQTKPSGVASGRSSSGAIGGEPAKQSSGFKEGDIREKNGVKYRRNADGKWYPI